MCLRRNLGTFVSAGDRNEAAWLIETRLGPAAEARLLTLVAGSRFTIVDRTPPTTDQSPRSTMQWGGVSVILYPFVLQSG